MAHALKRPKRITRTVTVELEASDAETMCDMLEQLCRTACDIANSTDDDHAFILISEPEAG